MNRRILVVNPGSTSTKIAVYETAKQDTEKQPHEAFSETLRHNAEELQRLVFDQRPSAELRALARENGMRSLREDGLLKVASGMTSLDEVLRVTMGDVN